VRDGISQAQWRRTKLGSDAALQAPVGVFDSGIGGLSILKALRAELPAQDFIYFADTAHAPYGERSDDHVVQRSRTVVAQLVNDHHIELLVVACNTATAAAIHILRAEHPQLLVVGVEPALKPAVALSQTRRIGVLATRGTLASAKFRALHASLADRAEFVLQPCDGLAAAIEAGDATETIALCARYARAAGRFGTHPGEIDTLVLGCTHYPFATPHLVDLVGPGVSLIETGAPVAQQTRRLLDAAGLLQAKASGKVKLLGSGALAPLEAAAKRWLGI
jgi:glutamate racemase